ncbi:MAG: double zinc ribbon domain-containing protein, partial [Thermoleophilia bacterium]
MTSLGRLADGVVDLFLPKRCVACGRAGRWLCEACAPALLPLPATVCRRCGAPLATSRSDCRECRGRDLAFATARAAYLYEGPARRLVTTCKFRSLRSLVAEMADLAEVPFRQAVAALGGVDLVTWVPVHRDRDLERGFDQAALLGRRLADLAG